jgi:hypothetical protein
MEANEIVAYKKTTKFKANTAKFKELLKVSELFELLWLFCLKQGCVHYILEAYAAHGGSGGHTVDTHFRNTDTDFNAHPSCSNACPACTGRYSSYFLPIHKSDAIIWLTEVLSKSGTIVCGGLDDMVVKLLWEKRNTGSTFLEKKT